MPTVLMLTIGCSDQAHDAGTKPPPGGGAMIRLPNGRGFVAVKTELLAGSPKGKTKTRAATIVAVFYQTDGVTPMTPAPTDVVFKIGPPENAKSVALSPDAGDPTRFTSLPGPYLNALQGIVHAKINGEDVEESFSAL
jgi:hypothetical protein